jgi:hypothetical protein
MERLKIPGLIFSEAKSRGHKAVCATKKRAAEDEDGRELPMLKERGADSIIAVAARIVTVAVSPCPACPDRWKPLSPVFHSA